ncbi:hypothetical protein [Streptomyces sp. NPDC049906]|uniref:hypothetical protein n=1 Tax=Streptomyces sp. NPDC049906 TaxID=3155656 RepID=UPI00342F10B5
MSQPTALATADSSIRAAWQRPVDTLQTLRSEGRTTDPTLVTVLRIRQGLLFSDAQMTAHQNLLHHLTRPGHVPDLLELDTMTSSTTQLRIAHAEAHARVRAICSVIDAHPEGQLADNLTRDLARTGVPRADAALARTTTGISTAPTAPAPGGAQAGEPVVPRPGRR